MARGSLDVAVLSRPVSGPLGAEREVDRYGGRIEGLLLMPAIAVAIYLLMLFVPRLDPGRMNYAKFAGAWYTMRASSLALLALLAR